MKMNLDVASLAENSRDDPLDGRGNLSIIPKVNRRKQEWFYSGYQGRYAEKDYGGNLGEPTVSKTKSYKGKPKRMRLQRQSDESVVAIMVETA